MEQGHACQEAPNMAIATLVEPTLTNTYVCAHLLTGQNRESELLSLLLPPFLSSFRIQTRALFPWLTAHYAQSEGNHNLCLRKWFAFQEAFVICHINTWRMRQGGVSSPGRAGHPPSFLTTSFAEKVPRRRRERVAVCLPCVA